MANPADRRRSARVEVLGRIQGQVVSLDVPIQVREISLGGMSVETPRPFPVGSVNVFMLTLGDGAGIDVAGRIVYSRPSADANRKFFVSGIQFIDQDDRNPTAPVSGLVTKIS
ncbi:MAG TPA: PilZ domain-containing protein [Vicinamibacterales bacterium]|nr:PilZ domain-containing protein [Vicinamibacterales bacterium]